MAKKQLTVEEVKAKNEKSKANRAKFAKTFLSTIAVLLSLVMTFSVVTIAFTYMGQSGTGVSVSGNGGNNTVTGDNGGSFDSSTGDFGETVTPDGGDATTDSTDSSTGDTPSDNAGNSGSSNAGADNSGSAGAADEKQEALDMYKKAVNNARTSAKSVVRVKDGAINYKGIVEAGGLSSVGSSLMGMFMAKNEAAIEVKNETWDKSKLPNANALTLNGVQKITREDKGSTYVITVVAKNATNPKANADGVGSIAGVIEESQITGAIGSVPGLALSNINIAYENVTAVATIDKATGNLVELKLNAPCVLGLDAKLALISVPNAKVGIQVITEYKISY